MSRVVVVGATGHIGTYLVPRLVRGGHEVIAMSRGLRGPYLRSPEWDAVTTVTVDRDAADADRSFGAQVAALRPDAVIDLICFTAASAQQLVDALRPARPLLVHCGTIWVHGPALRVPVTEDEPRTAYGDYGTGKAEIEALLHRETRAGGVPAIVLHPGHITGPGWPVITPAGNLDPQVWTKLATGQPLALPDHGLGILNHVHADDVAQAFERALAVPAAAGASFHMVAAQAMTLRGLATGAAGWFGREPVLEFVDWAEFGRRAGPGHAEATREHTFRGIAASIDRARQTLGHAPRFSSLDALHEALARLASPVCCAARTPRCSVPRSCPSGGASPGHPQRRAARVVGRAHPGQVIRPARHHPPAPGRRPADVDRRSVGAAVIGAGASREGPVHPPGRRTRSSRPSAVRCGTPS